MNSTTKELELKLPENVETVEITYDGGRFYVTINGQPFYVNPCAGNDFSVEITKNETTFRDFDY